MEAILCDELLEDIFHRLPPSSSSAVSLVSKRWLHLLRSSITSLSLRFTTDSDPTLHSLSSFLAHHPFLTSLALSSVSGGGDSVNLSDQFLLSIASSCRNLRSLRFLTGPLSLFPLFSLATSCPHLSSLAITLSRPLSFGWLASFRSLKELSIVLTGEFSPGEFNLTEINAGGTIGNLQAKLQMESLSLTGIRSGDYGLNWLWKNCKKLKKLQLRSCEGIGDYDSFSSFINCLNDLEEVELRTCRTIVDVVLLKLAENCDSLNSLVVYDGGSKEGLLRFIAQSRSNLKKLDLRLPLDLDNDHLSAIADNFCELSSFRLQSCCLVTGEGLKTLARAINNELQELALINCDVIEREHGLLTTLGQNLKQLKKLDLSHNEMLADKEMISMIVSCNNLIELKVRGCKNLTDAVLASMVKNCKQLQCVDIMCCCGIEEEGVEFLLLNSPQLKMVMVEKNKMSDMAWTWVSNNSIEIGH